MKTINYLLLILLSINFAIAQDIIDPPILPINFNDSEIFDRNFGQNHFIKGWNWGKAGRKLDEALYMNYYHN